MGKKYSFISIVNLYLIQVARKEVKKSGILNIYITNTPFEQHNCRFLESAENVNSKPNISKPSFFYVPFNSI